MLNSPVKSKSFGEECNVFTHLSRTTPIPISYIFAAVREK
jgi:hypothetical protein